MLQILSTFCTYNVTKSIRLSKTGRVHTLSITHDIVTAFSSLNLRSLASAKDREFCLRPKQEVRKTWTSGFLLRLRNLKQRQSRSDRLFRWIRVMQARGRHWNNNGPSVTKMGNYCVCLLSWFHAELSVQWCWPRGSQPHCCGSSEY